MCILAFGMRKVLIYNFYYDCIKNKYANNSKLLFPNTDILIYEIKLKMFDFSNYSLQSKYYADSNKLIVGKMTGEASGIAIEELVGLKPKMYSFFVYDGGENKKAKDMNENIVETISHSEYNDVLLNH